MTVVLTGPDYPERSDYAGAAISGVAEAEAGGALVFQGGTAARDERLAHERRPDPLGHRARRDARRRARERAYEAVAKIEFEGARFRTDIAATRG